MTAERRIEWLIRAVCLLGVAFAISLGLFIWTFVDQQAENSQQRAQNEQITALANAHHADSDRISAEQAVLIDKVDKLSCQRTIVTRSGLVTFFEQAARERQLAESQEPDPHAAALDAALVKADLLAAHQERSAGCDGSFPDGGSG